MMDLIGCFCDRQSLKIRPGLPEISQNSVLCQFLTKLFILKSFGLILAASFVLLVSPYATAQRGKIIKPGDFVMDPNQDGYVSKTTAGFSSRDYNVPEFEIKMFGIPKAGGDATGDNIGNSCGITDLIPDSLGAATYAARDANNNLIFRFRVGDDNPSVEAWSILLDTDGLFGADDPNSTPNNPGFEIVITLIKNSNQGVMVYNIDGIDTCPNPLLTYSFDTHFQISVADEATCGTPDYFYDIYVPFTDIANAFGIDANTGLKFASVSGVSATCPMNGKIADVSGVNDNNYNGCYSCMFADIVNAQCPTPINNLCETCVGFSVDIVHAPKIHQPLISGQPSISGTTVEPNIFVKVQVFTNIAPSGSPPAWGPTPRETHGVYAVDTVWMVVLDGPLQPFDKVVASTQLTQNSVPCGGGSGGNQTTTSVTVVQPNTPPVANNQSVTLPEDGSTAITLTGSDVDGNTLTYTVVTQPSHGTLTGTAPNLTYTPTLFYHGNDSFTFKVNDGSVDSNIATVSITITPVNHAPIANNQTITLPEDGSASITLTGSDVDGNALTYSLVTSPANGTLTGTAPNLIYTPNPNFNGNDSFTFKVNDGTVDSNIATVSISVTPVNDAPVANNQSVSLPEDTSTPITLTGSDVDGNSLTFSVVTPPAHGTLSGTAPNLTYVPAANFNGSDSFTFKVNDGTVDSNIGTVTISVTPVNDAPVAINQSVTLAEDTPKAITLTASDVDADPLVFSIVTPPAHGTLTGTAPNLTYTLASNFNGNDSFTFKVNDGTVDSNIATVSITVTPVNDPPVANNQTVSLPEDGSLAIALTGSDVDGDALSYAIVTPPAHGTLTGTAPNVTYNPALNYNGSDTFTFKVNDGTVDSNIATVSITITPVNDAPIANSQSVTLPEDGTSPITLTASDVDGDALTFTVVSLPAHGTLTGAAPNLTYTPAANYNGSDSFTFKVNDGTVDSNIASVSITVTPVNDPPVANNQSVSLAEDATKSITLTGSDVDGNALTFSIVVLPAHGTLTGTAPNLTYTPALNYNGSDSFTFKVNDGTVDSNIATVSITVTPVNDPPVANNQSVTLAEDASKAITLTGTDVDADPLTFAVVAPPSHGTLTGAAPNLTYTPAPNYNGNDSFTFKVNDGTVDSNIATVSITVTPVNDPPVANSQSVTLAEDATKAVTLTGSDVDGDALIFSIVTPPAHGTLTGTAPNLIYNPAANYNGSDNFTFKVNDGTVDSNIATVSITVTPVNDAPVANSQSVTLPEDGSAGITLSGTDIDGDALTYTVVSPPAHGTLTGSAPNLTYTPAPNYNGLDNFTFKVNDGTVDSNIAAVSITVTPVNDAPVANNQSVSLPEDGSTSIILTGSDVDGDALTYIVVASPSHGTLTGSAPNLTYVPALFYRGSDSFTFKVNDGTVDSNIATVSITVTPVNHAPIANDQNVIFQLNTPLPIVLTATDVDSDPLTYTVLTPPAHGILTGAAPNLTYTPNNNYNGSDNFTFKVNDGTVDSNIGTVSINFINGPNNPPVANNQNISLPEDGSAAITLTGSDVDGNALTFTLITTPAHGTLTGTAPNLVHSPALNYNGNDSFTFKANDGTVDSNVGTISITVTPVNDAPVASNQSVTLAEDTPKAITLTASDVDGDALTFAVVTPPAHGTLTGAAPNLTYTPAANYNGNDSFTFKANDGTVDSNNGTVSITVTPVNDPPIANAQSVSLPEDGSTLITLTGSDVDGNALTFSVVTSPTHGTLTGTAPNLTYTPSLNYNGGDTFTFRVNDGTVNSANAAVTITVTPVNDAPVANNQSTTLAEDTPKAITLTASDVDGDPLTYSIVTPPAHGTLTGAAPNVTYTPAANYNGNDSFTFKANDGTDDSNNGTVSITVTPVNDPPVANAQSVSLPEDGSLGIMLTGSDVDGDALTFAVVTPPAHGTLSGSAPNLTYSPAANYNGTDSFTFRANDGTVNSISATISITVTPVNDAPVANSQSASLAEDGTKAITLTGSDVDGDPLTFTVVAPPLNGSLSGTAPNLTYTPAANFNGNDSFTFKVNDGTVDSNNGTVTITVTPVNDAPVANAQTVTLPEDGSAAVTLTGSDIEGSTLTYSIVVLPAHGTLTGTAPNLIYTPVANYNGGDSFTFRVNDGTLNSPVAAVTITVTPVNDPPVANNKSVTLAEDGVKAITLTATDVDGDPLTYTVLTVPAHGALTGTAPNLTYTPAANYNGLDNFTFRVNDGTVNSNTATVSITITPVNDPPVANPQTITIAENTTTSITLTGTDVDGDPLTYAIIASPAHGTLTGTAPNLTYSPTTYFDGADSFTFRVNDGTVNSGVATISITITPVNQAPVANSQSVTLNEDASKALTLTASDIDGDPLTYTIISVPIHGTLSGSAPNLTYTPAANYNGLDALTFKVNDGTVDSNIGTISLVITPVNDAPVADSQSVSLDENTVASITLTGSDVDADPLTYAVVGSPAHGTLTGTAPNLTYIPAPHYSGADNFTFRVNDGIVNSNVATVTITVNFVNQAPVANDQTVNLLENAITPITLTGSDPDGDPLTYTVLSPPSHGTLAGTAPNLVYTPVSYYFGPDSFTFKDNDGLVDSNIGTVSIEVTYVNHPPVVEALPVLYVKEDSLRLVCPDVSDADGDPILFGLPTNTYGQGTMVQASAPYNFCYTFTPSLNNNGRSIWSMQLCDGGGLCASGAVEIIITPVNDPPIAVNDEIVAKARETTSYNVTTNDFNIAPPYQEFYDIFVNDPAYTDSLTLKSSAIAGPIHGSVVMHANGIVEYTPVFDYVGEDSIKYEVCDGGNLCTTAVAFIQVGYPSFKIYDGVSPNGDGKNDYWRIDGIEQYPNNSVKIFDRFNNLVYATSSYTNENNNWTGQANHGEFRSTLPEGTYYYSVNLGDGEHPISGFVMLKRQ